MLKTLFFTQNAYFSKADFLAPETYFLSKIGHNGMRKCLSKCLTDQQHVFGFSDKNEIKLNFLMNFRNSHFSFFITWMPIGPGHNSFSLEIVNLNFDNISCKFC